LWGWRSGPDINNSVAEILTHTLAMALGVIYHCNDVLDTVNTERYDSCYCSYLDRQLVHLLIQKLLNRRETKWLAHALHGLDIGYVLAYIAHCL